MSLSLVDLEVLTKAGQPKDRINAAKILPVLKNQHLLLCTLLIGNSLAMEALPIFLDALLPAWASVLISVTLILAFGEIIPQALCTRYGLRVGAKMAGVVRVLLVVFFPIAYPISKILDWLLGKGHFALMRRAELRTLVDMHGNEAGKGGELTHDETTIITGALDLTQKTAQDAMTKISDTFSIDINSKLDMDTMKLIMAKGHSRVPIYSGSQTNIIGLILVKNLITCRPEDEVPVRSVTIRKIPRVYGDLPLYDILNEFQKGHSHMAVVVKRAKDTGMNADKMSQSRKQFPVDSTAEGYHGLASASPAKGASGIQSPAFGAYGIQSPALGASGIQSPALRSIAEKPGDTRSLSKRSDRGRNTNILNLESDSLPSYSLDEEVVGIITMEDVMEELLQEEILDETDEYVDVHNKIKINMLPAKRSSPGSPGGGSIYQFQCRTPVASPLHSFHQASLLRSPGSPHTQPPATSPTFLGSPGRSPTSPTDRTSLGYNSPSSHRVSRKTYMSLREDGA